MADIPHQARRGSRRCALTVSSGSEEKEQLTELIKATPRIWPPFSSSKQRLLFQNEVPEKEDVSWCGTDFFYVATEIG